MRRRFTESGHTWHNFFPPILFEVQNCYIPFEYKIKFNHKPG